MTTLDHFFPNAFNGKTLMIVEDYSNRGVPLEYNLIPNEPIKSQEELDALLAEKATIRRELLISLLDSVLRKEAAANIMARWKTYNEMKVLTGEWSLEDLEDFMEYVEPVATSLNIYAFGKCAKKISKFNHPLATEQAKADYIAIMEAEYPPMKRT